MKKLIFSTLASTAAYVAVSVATVLTVSVVLTPKAWAQYAAGLSPTNVGMPTTNLVAVGQGIAAPNVTSLVNMGYGYLGAENPAGVMYQQELRLSVEYAKDGSSDTGFEAGDSNDNFGIAAGAHDPTCSGCYSTTAGILGASVDDMMDIGLRYSVSNKVPTYGAGLIFNPNGENRLGVDAEYVDPSGSTTQTLNYGAGYAYVDNDNTVSLESSFQQTQGTGGSTNKVDKVSLGYERREGSLEASMTYEDDVNASPSADDFYMGAGFSGDTLHLSVYSNYDLNMMVVLSAFF